MKQHSQHSRRHPHGLRKQCGSPDVQNRRTGADQGVPAEGLASDWPQWRGPNRDGVAPASPKLLDRWPKGGPSLLWKSEWIPACEEGGTGSPVVADGKVFVYANAKLPIGGGKPYQIVTPELLMEAGWLPDLPDELAKKIEAAWASPNRPSPDREWWNPERTKKSGELDAFLEKKPELAKYIKDFISTLKPQDAAQYGDYIKRRLCIDTPKNKFNTPNGLSWEQLVKLHALRDKAIPTHRQWATELGKIGINGSFTVRAFLRTVTLSDTIVCLDAATGREIWRKVFPVDPAVTKDPGVAWWTFGSGLTGTDCGLGVSATPAVWGGKCYAAGAMGLYCLSAKDGALLWHIKGPPNILRRWSPMASSTMSDAPTMPRPASCSGKIRSGTGSTKEVNGRRLQLPATAERGREELYHHHRLQRREHEFVLLPRTGNRESPLEVSKPHRHIDDDARRYLDGAPRVTGEAA